MEGLTRPGIRLQVSGFAGDSQPAGDACPPLLSCGLYPDADAVGEKGIQFLRDPCLAHQLHGQRAWCHTSFSVATGESTQGRAVRRSPYRFRAAWLVRPRLLPRRGRRYRAGRRRSRRSGAGRGAARDAHLTRGEVFDQEREQPALLAHPGATPAYLRAVRKPASAIVGTIHPETQGAQLLTSESRSSEAAQ